MHVLVAGASGFLGRHLVDALRGDGDEVTRLVRRTTTASDEVTWDPYATLDPSVLEGVDVVVNVAGSPTIGNPHSKKWARNLRGSRVSTTRTLAEAIAARPDPPAFLAGNASGWYGDHGSEVVTESTPSRGDSLLSRVCRAWQDATSPAAAAGSRVCVIRTTPVIDRQSAPLKQLVPLFRAGLGARLGDGGQFFPVVSLRDWLAAVRHLAHDPGINGPVNVCCPLTPTNVEFTQSVARAVGRRAFLAVPAPVIRLGAGDMAPEALGSVNLRPDVLEDAGFTFRDRDIDEVVAAGLATLRA